MHYILCLSICLYRAAGASLVREPMRDSPTHLPPMREMPTMLSKYCYRVCCSLQVRTHAVVEFLGLLLVRTFEMIDSLWLGRTVGGNVKGQRKYR